MQYAPGLFGNRCSDAWMRVPKPCHGETGQCIEVPLAIRVFEICTLTTLECHGQASISLHEM